MPSEQKRTILVMNCGSSTLKFELFAIATMGDGDHQLRRVARGLVDQIGAHASMELESEGRVERQSLAVADHAEATRMAVQVLESKDLLKAGELFAVGHRVIHGGDKFGAPAVINEEVDAAIDSLSELAPLHNQPALRAIRASRAALGPGIPMVAVFDTAFHQTMPEHAWRYAIDRGLAERHHIRRYGFHGLAHQYMMERYCLLTGRPPAETKLVTIQLGNGCSATAIKNGRSVDTSMGFTPLEGLIMGTRSGDVDPTLAGFIAERENVTIKTVGDWLNTKSGLLGVSGHSNDMRELLDAERKGDSGAALAIEMFCYRIKKYIGAYLAIMGGADAVIFGGGIGENAPEIRGRVCSGMEWLGISLDSDRNSAAVGKEADISADGASTKVYVIPVDEAQVIARETLSCLNSAQEAGGGP